MINSKALVIYYLCNFIYFTECLLKDSSRMWAGAHINISKAPYTVGVHVLDRYSESLISFCTGSLLTPKWILTAGHCFRSRVNRKIIVGIDFGVDDSNISKKIIAVHFVLHPNFDGYDNDMALVKLEQPLNLGDTVQTINVAEQLWPENDDNQTCSLAGFGRNLHGDTNIHYVEFTINKTAIICDKRHKLAEHFFCIKGELNGSACEGDSGAALVCNGKIVGIVHGGSLRFKNLNPTGLLAPCGNKNFDIVFIYVYPLVADIKEHMSFYRFNRDKPIERSAAGSHQKNFKLFTVLMHSLTVFMFIYLK